MLARSSGLARWSHPVSRAVLARRLENSFGRADAPYSISTAEQLNALGGTDAAAVIAIARGIAENLALPSRWRAGLGLFAGGHLVPSSPVGGG